jgi:hypothetical protein
MSRVNTMLFLILKTLKSLKLYKIAASVALQPVVRCGCFVCCGGVWISTPCQGGPICVCTDHRQQDAKYNKLITRCVENYEICIKIFI